MTQKKHLLTFLALGCLSAAASGQALKLKVTSPAKPSVSVTLVGDDIADIFDQAVSREADLEVFDGLDTDASLNYLGVDQALKLKISPDGKSAELFIPSTGLRKRFDASSTAVLEDQIEDYVTKSGSSEIAKFRKEVNKTSPVGITDGSPSSTTAVAADTLYRLSSPFDWGNRDGNGWSIAAESSTWSAGELDGDSFYLRITGALKTGKRSKFRVAVPLESRTIGKAQIYGGAFATSWDFNLLRVTPEKPWQWTLAPQLALAGRGSEELAAGGVLWTYGLNTALYRKIGDRQSLAFVAQYNGFEGIPLDYEDFQLDDDINQSLAKLGFQYDCQFARGNRLFASFTTSRFLEDAAIEDFNTVKLGVAKALGQSSAVSLWLARTDGGPFGETQLGLGLRW